MLRASYGLMRSCAELLTHPQRALALRGWVVGGAFQAWMGPPIHWDAGGLGRHLLESALIALIPATLVFWILWLPLRGFLARRSSLWRRRLPITLVAIVVFGLCGRLAEEFATFPPETIVGPLGHTTVLYALVGLVSSLAQDPDEIISVADYARPAFWVSVLTACLATIVIGFSLVAISSDEHNVTTGMSSGAVGLLGLIVAVPVFLASTAIAFLFRGKRRG